MGLVCEDSLARQEQAKSARSWGCHYHPRVPVSSCKLENRRTVAFPDKPFISSARVFFPATCHNGKSQQMIDS